MLCDCCVIQIVGIGVEVGLHLFLVEDAREEFSARVERSTSGILPWTECYFCISVHGILPCK